MTGNSEWNESLFGCFDDCGSCCRGFFCAPGLFGSNAQKIDNSSCVLMCCAYAILANCYLCWVPHLMKRKTLREKYGLREDPSCGDCPTTLCCSPCALCQEARFLKNSGRSQGIVMGVGPHVTQPVGHY